MFTWYHVRERFNNQNVLWLVAIMVAVALVGSAAWFVRSHGAFGARDEEPDYELVSIRPIQSSDHVFGNPNAPLIFIVYSDYACPYCKEYHDTLKHLLSLYGRRGHIAWVYRHMPAEQLHKFSPTYALASECVARDAGNSGFWKFTDLLFDHLETPETELSRTELIELATQAGTNAESFRTCVERNELMNNVKRDFDEAVATGAEATPFTVIFLNGEMQATEGQLTFAELAAVADSAVKTLDVPKRASRGSTTPVEFPASATVSTTTNARPWDSATGTREE